MNYRDFKVLFSYELKSKQNAVADARNINDSFENGSVNERMIRNWYEKFENWGCESHKRRLGQTRECCGQWSFKSSNWKKNPGNTVRNYAEELDASPSTTSRHLKLIGKDYKNG